MIVEWVGKREWWYRAKVYAVSDGDTLKAVVDLGFGVYKRVALRIYGIDSPERGEKGWAEARASAADILWPEGDDLEPVQVEIQSIVWEDKYGRSVATVRLPDGSDFGKRQIELGHAVAKDYA